MVHLKCCMCLYADLLVWYKVKKGKDRNWCNVNVASLTAQSGGAGWNVLFVEGVNNIIDKAGWII